jgi:hypothetical protein
MARSQFCHILSHVTNEALALCFSLNLSFYSEAARRDASGNAAR